MWAAPSYRQVGDGPAESVARIQIPPLLVVLSPEPGMVPVMARTPSPMAGAEPSVHPKVDG